MRANPVKKAKTSYSQVTRATKNFWNTLRKSVWAKQVAIFHLLVTISSLKRSARLSLTREEFILSMQRKTILMIHKRSRMKSMKKEKMNMATYFQSQSLSLCPLAPKSMLQSILWALVRKEKLTRVTLAYSLCSWTFW